MIQELIKMAEMRFKNIYDTNESEARLCVYMDRKMGVNKLRAFRVADNFKSTATSVVGSPDMFFRNDTDFPLILDLHSHHTMGAYWSATDDAHEKVQYIVFGVCAFADCEHDTPCEWKFRYWNGSEYITLDSVDDVIVYIKELYSEV